MTALAPPAGRPALGRAEFVALMAMLAATVAFSIDAMLPALPEIGAALSPEAPERAQFVITAFVFGMGAGTFFAGPISDAFGRRPAIVAGAALYILGAALAGTAQTLEMLLIGRAVQGLGAAGPRVTMIALVRDLYSGAAMARIMSFVMVTFSLVPAVAPLIGAGLIAVAGWRGVFGAFLAFSVLSVGWLLLRQGETLPPDARRPLSLSRIAGAIGEILSRRIVVLAILVQTLSFAMLFSVLSTVSYVFDGVFDRAASFPLWFGGIAIVAASGALLNARLVERFEMRRIVLGALLAQAALSGATAAASAAGMEGEAFFALFLVWTTGVFFMAGLVMGNVNAMAMEPLPHIAGMAASVIGSVATVGAVLVAAPIGMSFDGTVTPVALGIALCAVGASALTAAIPRG